MSMVWVLLEVVLNCFAPKYPISTNYSTYRTFSCGFMAAYKYECTPVENKGTIIYLPAAAHLLRSWFESHRGHGYLSFVSVVCCQVEVSATS